MMALSSLSLAAILLLITFKSPLIVSSREDFVWSPNTFCSNGSLVVVPAVTEDQIELQCSPCGVDDSGLVHEERVWYRENVVDKVWRKLNSSLDGHVRVRLAQSLVIRNFSSNIDGGHYKCQDYQNNIHSYYVDGNFKDAEVAEITDSELRYRFFLSEGNSWIIKCPVRINPNSAVEWWRNGVLMGAEPLHPGGKCGFWCACSFLVARHTYGDLIVKHASPSLGGNFTCFAEDKLWDFRLTVLPTPYYMCSPSEIAIFTLLVSLMLTVTLLTCAATSQSFRNCICCRSQSEMVAYPLIGVPGTFTRINPHA